MTLAGPLAAPPAAGYVPPYVRRVREEAALAWITPLPRAAREVDAGTPVLIAVLRNESAVMPEFLTHYRGLGVERFALIDNGSTDETRALLAAEPDVDLYAVGRPFSGKQGWVTEEQAGAGGLDHRPDLWPLVAGQVVHDDDVAGSELGDKNPLDIGLEGLAVDRPREHEGRDHAAEREGRDDGGRLPVPVRHADPQPFAAPGAAMGAGHVRLRPGLVDEHQASGIEVGLRLEPGLAPLQDVRTVLLAGVRRLFLRVIRRRTKKRRSVP
jgi:hypothetical protein